MFGYFFLDPVHYNTLSYTSISAILFYSNILFNESQSYFSPEYNTKMLLHTWSISVEWQFYMLYPILLMGLNRFAAARRHMTAVLVAIVSVSLALCIYYSAKDQPTAFYLLPQRAWEMAAGGIVALNFKTRAPKHSGLLLSAGFLLIGASVLFFNKNLIWPSYWAVAPVLGTCFVIAANRRAPGPTRIRAVQTLGKWSYSICLWHWPIAVMFVYFNFTQPSIELVLSQLAVLAAIILSGALLLWGAKKLSARIDWTSAAPRPGWRAGALAASFAITLAFALGVDSTRGFANRTPEVAREVQIYKTASADWDFPQDCDGVDDAGNLGPCHLGPSQGRRDADPRRFVLEAGLPSPRSGEGQSARLVHLPDLLRLPPITGYRISGHVPLQRLLRQGLRLRRPTKPRPHRARLRNWPGYFTPQRGNICFVVGEFLRHEAS